VPGKSSSIIAFTWSAVGGPIGIDWASSLIGGTVAADE
jgi:hypothetical protein